MLGPADPAARPVRDLSTATAATMAAGGAALAASAFLPWLDRGSGSTLPLHEVGDVLLREQWSGVPRWLGFLAYVVPICGGLAMVASGLPERRAGRLATILCGVVTLLLVATGVVLIVRHRMPATGYAIAVLGDLATIGGAVWARHDMNRQAISVQ